jgi:hypothetical protein
MIVALHRTRLRPLDVIRRHLTAGWEAQFGGLFRSIDVVILILQAVGHQPSS